MLKLNCFICGLARDCAEALPASLHVLDHLARCFEKVDIVAVTNNSVDRTSEILTCWAAGSPSRTLLRTEGLATAVPGRTDRLATLRNFYLLEMRRRIEAGNRFDLMIVFDYDGVNRRADLADALANAVTAAPVGWGALFANQRQAYYDIWALRHPRWCPDDCWESVHQSLRFVPWRWRSRVKEAAIARFLGARQVRIPPSVPPIEVEVRIRRTGDLSGLRARQGMVFWPQSGGPRGVRACDLQFMRPPGWR